MSPSETLRLQAYLKDKFGNDTIKLKQRPQAPDSVEMMIGDEFIGIAFRDDEDGEVSYSISICVLEEDLPTL